jgi:translation initiation factor 2 subunit 3
MPKKSTSKEKTPEINIGLFGHVDHGKTTLTEQLSGKWTDTHSEELKRGITIRLGYADTAIRKIKGVPEPDCWTTKEKVDGKETEFVRRITLVDAPGHESLMATMLSGATMIDGAIVLISATEECPQPQTREHIMALEILGIDKVIIVQNKIDLVDEKQIKKNFIQIKKFLMNTKYSKAPIIPISAQHGINIDLLIDAIQITIPTPKRNTNEDPIIKRGRLEIRKHGNKGKKK